MEMEFKIRYRIDGDIPINPAWIRDQLNLSVQALQKEINKKLKLPYDLKDGELSTEMVTRQNPFSGQSIQLPEFAAVIYDKTIELNLKAERKDSATGQPPGISEHQDDWQLVRNGIDFFREHFAREYMVLLD